MRKWLVITIICSETLSSLAAQSKIRPFSAEQILTDYTSGLRTTKIVAGRSDGARVTVQSVVSGQLGYSVEHPAYSRELTLPNGMALRLVDAVRAKSTWRRRPETEAASMLQALADPPPDCGVSRSSAKVIGHDIVQGLEALITQEMANDGRKTLQWVVPALGCTAVRSTIQQAPPNGPPVLVFETRLFRLTLAEPDERLFYIGTDYSEMKPSRALDLQQTALHVAVNDRLGASLDLKYDTQPR